MKKLSTLFAVAALVAGFSSANAIDNHAINDGQVGTVVDAGDGSCGDLIFNSDGTYENGYCWQYGGCVAPDYGAFAEGYVGEAEVCAAVFDLSQTGGQNGQTMDVYVWDDEGGIPGAVNAVANGVDPGPTAFWPSLSRHTVSIDAECADNYWVGYWGNWPELGCAWFVGADTDGFGGAPYTNIAPGIGFPTGWSNVSVAWGPTQALGIGAEVTECGVSPTIDSTWGTIKALYQ